MPGRRGQLFFPLCVVVAVAIAWALGLWLGGEKPRDGTLRLVPAAFADLPGWDADDFTDAGIALGRSCAHLDDLPEDRELGGAGYAGTVADWRSFCAALAAIDAADGNALRPLLQQWLTPLLVIDGTQETGLFTGYYEASLNGSRRRHGAFQIPILGLPPDLISVDLGAFRAEFRGRRIAGRVADGRLLPYADRAAIETGALAEQGLEIAWVDDPVDAFFLHIQGSGRIALDDGGDMRVGYAAQNGHAYRAIGRDLVDSGAIARPDISMQSIRRWMAAHPDAARALMRRNASYVFFRELAGGGPIGAGGSVLTPARSLAVDRKWHALDVPAWFAGQVPDDNGDAASPARQMARLMITQDTGGAITGIIRGDVFWGHGPRAASIAGRMQGRGRLWLLLPIPLAAKHR